MNDGQEQFQATVKTRLDEGMEQLDEGTLRGLRQARMQALEAAVQPSRWQAWAPGMAVASVAVIVATLWLAVPEPQMLPTPGFEELELLVDSQDLEFYQDMDFYYWLAIDEVADAAG